MAATLFERPALAQKHYQQGVELKTNGKLLEAEAHDVLRRGAELNGGSNPRKCRALANLLLGEAHLQASHLKRARWRLLNAQALDPENEEILSLLKQARLEIRRFFLLRQGRKS